MIWSSALWDIANRPPGLAKNSYKLTQVTTIQICKIN